MDRDGFDILLFAGVVFLAVWCWNLSDALDSANSYIGVVEDDLDRLSSRVADLERRVTGW